MPKDWRLYILGDIAVTQSGGTPSRHDKSFYNGSIPWIKSGELKDNDIYDSKEKITPEGITSSSAKIFKPNTLLLAMYGATVGRTGVLKTSAATNQAICAIQPIENSFNVMFLKYYLINIRPKLLRERYGGAQPNISQTLIKNLKIYLPHLREQRKIATVLYEIQKAIEIQEKIIETTRELKKSTMQHVFTYGLQGEKTKETEIGRIPESWKIRPLGSFCVVIMGQSPGGEFYNKSGNGMSLLNGPAEFTDKYPVAVQWTTKPTKIAVKGDILFCVRGNTVARMNIADQNYCIGRGIAAIRGFKGQSVTEFLLYLIEFNAKRIYSHATAGGSTFPNFSKTDFDFICVQNPLISEQIKIAGILQAIDQKAEIHTAKTSALRDLFKTMLNKLMVGEIRVKDLEIDMLD